MQKIARAIAAKAAPERASRQAPVRVKQQFRGNGSIQIGSGEGPVSVGPITITKGPRLDPRNPKLRPCSACDNLISVRAPVCPICGDKAGEASLEAQEKVQRSDRIKLVLRCIGVASTAWAIGMIYLKMSKAHWALALATTVLAPGEGLPV